MARASNRLTAVAVARAAKPGLLSDGHGLYLRIGPTGAKSWVFRYRRGGKLHDLGLGATHTVSLADARLKALDCRKQRLTGVDPLAAKHEAVARERIADAKSMTFRACAEAYIAAHRTGWKNPKHAAQWPSTLETYVYPLFGNLPAQAVDVGLVVEAVEPIWTTIPETAGRVRGRIESVLDWATTRGYRQGDNPARWRGHLENLLPKRSKVSAVAHHPALPYDQLPAFIAELRQQSSVAARALEYLILTAARTGEVIGAAPGEIKEKIWIVPAGRMKGGREHRVPLSSVALAIVEDMKAISQGELVFPGAKPGKPLSNMTMTMLLRRMGRRDLTVHGFRSTFRDWAAERTNFPQEVCEMALAHAVPDRVEAAYRRGDLFEKRRQLMDAWARFCGTPTAANGAVVVLRKA